MLTMEKTADYVKRWVAAFESKDLDSVLAFYANDVIFHSPLVARLSHDPSGTVRGKVGASFVDQGEQQVKNIAHPVRAYKLMPAASTGSTEATSAAPPSQAPMPRLPGKPSLAVLPDYVFVRPDDFSHTLAYRLIEQN